MIAAETLGMLRDSIARVVTPVRPVRPSTWAERNVVVRTGPRQGPWRNDFKPWTACVQDLRTDYPDKQGAIEVKPGQIGSSYAKINTICALLATDPGPVLYIIDENKKALDFANSRFLPIVRAIDHLAGHIDQSSSRKAGRRQLLAHYEFPWGPVDFTGAGSESGAISADRRYVFVDEYELSSRNFPAKSGSLYETVVNRTELWRGRSFVWIFGHPRAWDDDIHALFTEFSDERRWSWDCPHCGGLIDPTDWDGLIDWGETDSAGRRVPSRARLVCPHEGCEVTDAQRAKACEPPERGGTGRLWTPLDPSVAKARPFVGCWITRLSDPAVTLRELAASYCSAKSTEAQQTWMNKAFGAPFRRASARLTRDIVRQCLPEGPGRPKPPGDRHGIQFVTSGVDVQMPRENPTLYFAAMGYAPTGMAYLLDLHLCHGWADYHAYRAAWSVELADGRVLGLKLSALDCGWETKQVLTETRRAAYSEVSNALIPQIALNYNSICHGDRVVAEVPPQKCIDPMRPDLGPVERRYLHRHTWVDRMLNRVSAGQLEILCDLPEEFESHVLSQILVEHKPQHRSHEAILEWNRAKEKRDDWLMAMVYAEAGAAIRCGLDSLHELTNPRTASRKPPRAPDIFGFGG